MEQAVRAKQQEAADAYADALVQQVIAGMEVEHSGAPWSSASWTVSCRSMEQQLQSQGASLDAYLEMAGITREDLRRQAGEQRPGLGGV